MATKKDTSAKLDTAPRLRVAYSTQFIAELKDELSLSNINQVPKLEKIVVSVGTGKFKDDKKKVDDSLL